MGTVNNNEEAFYKKCFEAFKDEKLNVIMSVGNDIDIDSLGEIPSNFIVEKHVDQISVLKITDVFITHCGMNSVSEALYDAIPLVLFPQTTEQKGVANRVKELNAGIYLENINNPAEIKNVVLYVLKNKELKEGASKIKDSFLECGGAKEAAKFIENKGNK